jgi:hypothetical protein
MGTTARSVPSFTLIILPCLAFSFPLDLSLAVVDSFTVLSMSRALGLEGVWKFFASLLAYLGINHLINYTPPILLSCVLYSLAEQVMRHAFGAINEASIKKRNLDKLVHVFIKCLNAAIVTWCTLVASKQQTSEGPALQAAPLTAVYAG